jgi:hypothetical protein
MGGKRRFFLDTPTYIRQMALVLLSVTALLIVSTFIVFLIEKDIPSFSFILKAWAAFVVLGAIRPTYLYLNERFYYNDDDNLTI